MDAERSGTSGIRVPPSHWYHASRGPVRVIRTRAQFTDPSGQCGQGRTFKQHTEGEFDVEDVKDARHNLCGKERITAECKEVRVAMWMGSSKHLLPDIGQPCSRERFADSRSRLRRFQRSDRNPTCSR